MTTNDKSNKFLPERSIGSRISKLRESLGLNFEQFSALTREFDAEGNGIAAVTLRRYERTDDGSTNPGLRELRILCDALDVSADFLVRGIEPDPTNADWEALKAIIQRATSEHERPHLTGKDPYSNFARQESLKRARLHTKQTKPK